MQSTLVTSQRHNRVLKPRPSKFLEGSMNDRVSTKPPSIYMRDEEAMDRYDNQSAQDCTDLDEEKTYYDAGIQPVKPSGMYRFGKALASAFNPINVWQGINGIWKDKEEKQLAGNSVLQDRKIKAEKAYAELKKNEYKGTQPFSTRAASIDQSNISGRRSHDQSIRSSLRDSGVDVDEAHTSTISKQRQPTPTGSEDLLIPQSMPQPATSPGTQASGGRRTSLNLRRPPFQSLKKVKSHIQLPSTKRKAADVPVPVPSPTSKLASGQNNEQGLRRQPSKKDVAKQKKLSRQVSDLECKLEAARRELQLSRGQAPEVPKIPKSARQPFKPGTLPSLPSESILNPATSAQESDPEWKPPSSRRTQKDISTPKKPAIKATAIKTPKRAAQLESDKQEAVPTNSGKKRKSSGGRAADRSYKPGRNTDNDSDTDGSVATKRIPRARKSQKTEDTSVSQAMEANPKHTPASATKGSRTLIPKTHKSVPCIPTSAALLDLASVDEKKLLAMRSVPMDNLPFGSHLDDIINLQKEFPDCSQKQIDAFLSSLQKSRKAEQQAAFNTQLTMSLLERATSSASPINVRTLEKVEKASATTTQACKNSSPNKAMGKGLSTIDEAITVDPSKDKSIPPLPISPIKTGQNSKASTGAKVKNTNKPLPDTQKENYNWPEDVF